MEFNEIDVLRKQNEILVGRIAELEKQNSQHVAMLHIVTEQSKKQAKDND